MKYLYFISFTFQDSKERTGSGNREYRMQRTINGINDIISISKWIEGTQKDKFGETKVVITNYHLMKKLRGHFS